MGRWDGGRSTRGGRGRERGATSTSSPPRAPPPSPPPPRRSCPAPCRTWDRRRTRGGERAPGEAWGAPRGRHRAAQGRQLPPARRARRSPCPLFPPISPRYWLWTARRRPRPPPRTTAAAWTRRPRRRGPRRSPWCSPTAPEPCRPWRGGVGCGAEAGGALRGGGVCARRGRARRPLSLATARPAASLPPPPLPRPRPRPRAPRPARPWAGARGRRRRRFRRPPTRAPNSGARPLAAPA